MLSAAQIACHLVEERTARRPHAIRRSLGRGRRVGAKRTFGFVQCAQPVLLLQPPQQPPLVSLVANAFSATMVTFLILPIVVIFSSAVVVFKALSALETTLGFVCIRAIVKLTVGIRRIVVFVLVAVTVTVIRMIIAIAIEIGIVAASLIKGRNGGGARTGARY
jgi:hypothetical protein